MTFVERTIEKAFRAIGATEMVRDYSASKRGRLVGDHLEYNRSANQEVRSSIRQLRALGRALARDNDWFIGFLKKLEANVIGTHGLKLQVDAKKGDGTKKEDLNRKVEDAWKEWSCKKNCDVTGQQSLRDMAALFLRTVATDGECLARFVVDPSSPYSLKIQMLDTDWLDEDYNVLAEQAPNGNRIVMSVEVDEFEKPTAYWFRNPLWQSVSVPDLQIMPQGIRRLRIPADQILHRFIKDRIGMMRGITWPHGTMLTLNQLDGFDEAELIGARINASNMAFVSPPAPLDSAGATKPETVDTEVAPGQVLELPAGYTVHEFSPNKPQDASFSKRLLHKIASSLGISFTTLTGDLSEVNFSSIRAGTLEERSLYRILQQWVAEHFYQDVYEKWLMFNAAGLVPVTAIDQIMYPIWRGRGFDWVDPLKDVTAQALAVDRGFTTVTEVLAERSRDFEETIDQIAYEQEYMKKKNVSLASAMSMQEAQAQIAADAASQAQDAKANADKGKSKGATGK